MGNSVDFSASSLSAALPLAGCAMMIAAGKKGGVRARKRLGLSMLAGLVVTPVVLLIGMLATLAFVSATSIRVSVPFFIETVLVDPDGNGPRVEGGPGIGWLALAIVVGVTVALYRYDARRSRSEH